MVSVGQPPDNVPRRSPFRVRAGYLQGILPVNLSLRHIGRDNTIMSGITPQRRWYRFSIRTLLLVMLVAVVAVGGIVARLNRAWKNQERVDASEKADAKIVAKIEELGGRVSERYFLDRRPQTRLEEWLDDPGDADDPVAVMHIKSVNLCGADAAIEYLGGLGNIQSLTLAQTHLTNTRLVHLRGVTSLRSLSLELTNITDADLDHLQGLTNLLDLNLGVTNITDVGLEKLKGLKKLQDLRLGGTGVTDAGLKHLIGMRDLQFLSLRGCDITEDGLKHLKGLTSLRYLDIGSTRVTDTGLEHLRDLTHLEDLHLGDIEFSDAWLAFLKGLKKLKFLNLGQTKLTEKQHYELFLALPNIR
jgi:hypothetical protein